MKAAREWSSYAIHAEPKPAPESLVFALQAASLLRHYRETYGFKITLAFNFQAAAVISFTLLNRPQFSLNPSSALLEGNPVPFQDAQSAFEESYRCLLGIGTRVMIARGVARMVYQTSQVTGKALPGAAQHVLEIVSEAAWRSTDVHRISSIFPNYSMIGDVDGKHEARMEGLLKQWEAVMT
jgi:hypothetical protein